MFANEYASMIKINYQIHVNFSVDNQNVEVLKALKIVQFRTFWP